MEVRLLVREKSGGSRLCSIVNEVRHDQSRWEEDEAEKEVEEEAVPLARSNPGRPERDQYPEDEQNDRPEPPTTYGNEHLSSGH
jgi:hypothetical protein